MRLGRLFHHLVIPDWWARRAFQKPVLRRIEQAIATSEQSHGGELRVVVEANLPFAALLRDRSPRQRAVELFGELGVWDTEHNCGVLIYLQVLDRRVEIVADRGIHRRVGDAFWKAVCGRLEKSFRDGQYEQGVVRALEEITAALAEHFPAAADNPDELSNAPLIF